MWVVNIETSPCLSGSINNILVYPSAPLKAKFHPSLLRLDCNKITPASYMLSTAVLKHETGIMWKVPNPPRMLQNKHQIVQVDHKYFAY